MELLEKKICEEGRILKGDVLKVDSFLNHQLDVDFLNQLGEEFYRLFAASGANKILTLESNGIGVACMTAQRFHCPVVFAKKKPTPYHSQNRWSATVHSHSGKGDHDISISKRFLNEGDRVLIIDDVLVKGSAIEALVNICRQAGAEVVGAGIVIEKAYRSGGKKLRSAGLRVESLARIISMDEATGIKFC